LRYSEIKLVYLITYPNGKIYVGSDLTGSVNYFGSAFSPYIEQDFTLEELFDFTISRRVLWYSAVASDKEVRQVERKFIQLLRSNEPDIGYNRTQRKKTGT
jgi:hypothetical protein